MKGYWAGGWGLWQKMAACFSSGLGGWGLSSGTLLGVSGCPRGWPCSRRLWVGGEEPLRQGRPECPFLSLGEVL